MTDLKTQDTEVEVPPEPTPPRTRGTVMGRFVVLDTIGEGGMGVVYRAYDPELDRQIALKLVRQRRGDPARMRARVQREAQALAQLSHPNVVAIYDIGIFDEQVFIAMELVDGQDLRAWLLSAPRSQEEILKVCVGAGEGLAAAHRAGLVHRDFKPENVIVGKDGRVHVLDFGLARAVHARDTGGELGDASAEFEPPSGVSATSERSLGGRRLGEHLTGHGTVLGTPAYMSPEHVDGKRVDARSDQFSFCVTLFEALSGQHPFGAQKRGGSVGWEVRKPELSRVPAWLQSVLMRGLSREPSDRFPSMDELLVTLRADPEGARRARVRAMRSAALIAFLGALLGVAFAVLGQGSSRAAPCAGVDSLVQRFWSPAARASVRTAFGSAAVPYADGALRSVEAHLDRYAAEWSAMRVETCRATHERHEQSTELLERKVLCLEELALDLDGLVQVLGRADAEVVQRAVAAAYQLRPVRDCVAAGGRAHRGAAASASLEAEVRTQLARTRALERTGQYERGVQEAKAALARAVDLGPSYEHGEALFWMAKLQEDTAAYDQAERTYFDAVALSDRAGYDELRARAMSRLVYVIGYRQARYAEGRRLGELAAATVDRLGQNTLVRADLESNLGSLNYSERRFDEAAVHDQRALALREALLGDEDPQVAASLNNLGLLYCDTGRRVEALEPLTRALVLRKRVLGENHPDVAASLSNLGLANYLLGRHAEAGELYVQALALRERVLGPAHPSLAFTLEGLGTVRGAQGHTDEAIPLLRRAAQIREAAFGPDHPDVAVSLLGLGQALVAGGQLPEALALERRALASFGIAYGVESVDYALANASIGEILRRQGHADEALSRLRPSAALLERELGEEDPEVARVWLSWGQALGAHGERQEATTRLERLLALCRRGDACTPLVLAQTQVELGALAGDRARARQFAESARTVFGTLPHTVPDVAAGLAAAESLLARSASTSH